MKGSKQRRLSNTLRSLRSHVGIQKMCERCNQMVGRGGTSGKQERDFCAPEQCRSLVPRLQRGNTWTNDSRRFTSGYLLFAASRRIRISKHVLNLIGLIFVWAAVSGICANGQANQANRIIGLVKEVSGEWRVEGSTKTKLAVKDRVPPGGKIIAAPGNPAESRIVISLFDGSVVEASCRKKGPCNSTIQLPKSLNIERPQSKVVAENNDFFGRAGRVFQSLWGNGGKKDYKGTLTRSGGLQNAVIKIAGGSINLSPALQNLGNKICFLRLCPAGIEDDKQCEQQAQIISFTLVNGIAPFLPATEMPPGAYRLMLYDFINQTYLPTDETSVVYLCPAKNYESMKAAFEEAVLASNRWGAKVEPSQELFLRQYLIELARETQQKN
jgi:hypothetical protein